MKSTGLWCRDVIAIAGVALLCTQPARAQSVDPVATIERAEAAMLDGRRAEALRLAGRAAAPCMAPGPDARACIYVLDTAAGAASLLRRFDLAVPWLERSLALSRDTLGARHPATVLGLSNYALALREAYRFADAADAYREALSLTDPAAPGASRLRSALADLLRETGDYDEAEPLARLAFEDARARGPGSTETGVALDVLGRVLLRQERYAEAEAIFAEAMAVLGGEGPAADQHQAWVNAASNRALALAELGRHAEAEPIQREILAAMRNWLREDDPELLAVTANLAATLSEEGKHEDARKLLQPALATARGRVGADSLTAAGMAYNLALVEERAGAFDRAEPLLGDAVRIRRQVYGERHPLTISALEALGRVRARRDPAAALEALRPAVAAVVANAAGVAVDPRSALALRARRSLFLVTIDALLAAGGDANLLEAFEVGQWAMTSESAVAISRVAARRAGSSDELAVLEARRMTLVADRTAVEGAYYALAGVTDAESAELRRSLAERLGALEPQIREAEQAVAAIDPGYFELSRPAVLSADAARHLLQPGEALLVLLPGTEASYTFALTRDEGAWGKTTLAGDSLRELVWRARQSAQDDVGFTPTAFDREAAFQLYTGLIAPVSALLAGRDRLMVVADGALAAVPPGLLVTEQPTGDGEDPAVLQRTAWLSDRHAISTLPAVGSLQALRCLLAEHPATGCAAPALPREPRAARHPVQFAGVGAPVLTGPAPPAQRGASGAAPAYGNAFTGGLADTEYLRRLAPLPGAARELELMRATFPGGAASLLIGPDARESAVKTDAAVAGARYLVFSTHGLLARQSGAVGEPGLVLTPPEAARRSALDDGLLTASEAAQLSLAAELLVLSACNTGTPDGNGAAGGLSGLSRAFFVAGARAMVVSHWAVSDLGTAALMSAFFRRIEAEPDAPRAVLFGQAMAEVRRIPELASPGFWSAFTFVGTGD